LAAQNAPPLRVLFVGNSYTYTNQLPEVARRVAAARGITLSVSKVTEPGAAIEDLFDTANLATALQQNWDIVVLQQGPSSLVDNRRHLAYWTAEVARLVAAQGSRIVLFSVWPAEQNAHTWHAAELSYAKAANRVGGCVFPAAGAWRLARADGLRNPLYSADLLHPTRTGTLLAALSMVHALWGGPGLADLARQFPEAAWRESMAVAEALDRYARQAVQESMAPCAAE
jgi:hypothetical protein